MTNPNNKQKRHWFFTSIKVLIVVKILWFVTVMLDVPLFSLFQ